MTEQKKNKINERFSKDMDMRKLNRSIDWRISAAQRRAQDALTFSAKTEDRFCPLCGESRAQPLAEIYGFFYVNCENCKHVYVKNMPTREQLKDFYENNLGNVQMRPSEDLVQKDLYLTRVKEIAVPKVEYITLCLGKVGRWVDIGCGSGEILYAAKEKGWDTTGYEIDPDEIHVARDVFKLNIVPGYVDETNAAKVLKGADIVSFFSVLEHIPDPLETLKVIARHMDQEAVLVLELPHHPSLSAFTNMSFPHLVARHMLPPNHLHLFTDESVRYILEGVGFEPVDVWYYGQDFYELISTVKAQAKNTDEESFNRILDETAKFQAMIDRMKLSDEFIVVARRKGEQ